MANMKERLIGTRNFALNVIGEFSPVHINPPHELPAEIQKEVLSRWLLAIEGKKKDLTAKGFPESAVMVDENAQPLPELKVLDNGEWKRSMFSGPMLRVDGFEAQAGNFVMQGSQTDYGTVMATQNFDPFGILDKYGMDGLPNPLALTVDPVFVNKDGGEVAQIFKRSQTVSEYPGYLHTAAGQVSGISPDALLKTAVGEQFSESGLAPRVEFPSQLKELGIVKRDADVEFKKLAGLDGVVVKRAGKEQVAVFYENKPRITGMVTNVDVDDYDSTGRSTPRFKYEIMSKNVTGIDFETYQSLELWPKNEEHESVRYVRVDTEGVRDFIFTAQAPPDRAIPVTQAALLYALLDNYELKDMLGILEEMNEKFPIGGDHPFYSRLNDGRLARAGYNTQTLIQSKR